MAEDPAPSPSSYVYERLRTMIASGFYTKKQVFSAIAEEIAGAPELAAEAPKLRGYAAKQWTAQEQAEQTWTERTANDCLDAAFVALNEAGFVALQNAGWTNTTGWEDCWSVYRERRERHKSGTAPRGAVFYHYQDLERGVAGQGLMLGFGCFHEDDDGDLEGNAKVAAEVRQILQSYGVDTEWSGDPHTRIRVQPFVWRRRQHTKAPPPAEPPGPWQRFRHPDGRGWQVRRLGAVVDLRILLPRAGDDPGGDSEPTTTTIERRRQHASAAAAERHVAKLIAEQLADGFVAEEDAS